jgi:hypothetical protein
LAVFVQGLRRNEADINQAKKAVESAERAAKEMAIRLEERDKRIQAAIGG